ncbi:MAG: hypothetical protein LBV12_08770 [Puniceicoccales bacterium]|jgi:hypothetical protein|nr:hypothetical protein [Puniceicoccales bacterium]
MKNHRSYTLSAILAVATLALPSGNIQAEYHNFDNTKDAQAYVQEVRWPYWAESTYNALYYQTITGTHGGNKASAFFYGGVPHASPEYPKSGSPASIIWSFWPPNGCNGEAVKPAFTGPNMYAPPHIGEGASGKVDGFWPQFKTNKWYRFACRIWKPVDGTPDVGYAAKWMRDPDTKIWYHYATMRLPLSPEGMNGLCGFNEDFYHGNRKPRRTDFRNVYYFRQGAWESANHFHASVRQKGERGTIGLIENDTVAFFETCSSPDYKGNLDFDTGKKGETLTMKQAEQPDFDPIVVQDPRAVYHGNQLVVTWKMADISSPQFAYRIEIFDNVSFSGKPIVNVFDYAPEVRQKLIEIPSGIKPSVRLTITDVFDRTAKPVQLRAVAPTPAAALANPSQTQQQGLDYQYYEGEWSTLPDFAKLQNNGEGSVAFPDLTPRRRRENYAFNYTGFLDIPTTGLYTFTLRSADGTRLLIDGNTVVDHDGIHSPSDKSGYAVLAQGRHLVNVLYFFKKQVGKAGDDIDGLKLQYAGPGIRQQEIPFSAWSRAMVIGRPQVTLESPAPSISVPSGHVALQAKVASNGAKIDKVRFYVDGYYWGETSNEPYSLNTVLWSKTDNNVRARVIYNGNRSVDSEVNKVTTTPEDMSPWTLSGVSEHTQGFGGKLDNGNIHLIGDGLNICHQEMNGDCTIITKVSGLISAGQGPDGKYSDWSWHAGIIFRESLTRTPGMPLGNKNGNRFAALFTTVNYGTHFQDNTMENAGGPYWSKEVGRQRWLKIQRTGEVFTSSISENGTDWKVCNTVTLKGAPAKMYVGVYTYAPQSENTNVHRATFEQVTLKKS